MYIYIYHGKRPAPCTAGTYLTTPTATLHVVSERAFHPPLPCVYIAHPPYTNVHCVCWSYLTGRGLPARAFPRRQPASDHGTCQPFPWEDGQARAHSPDSSPCKIRHTYTVCVCLLQGGVYTYAVCVLQGGGCVCRVHGDLSAAIERDQFAADWANGEGVFLRISL